VIVNISYSIDIDDVPSVVHKFLKNEVHGQINNELTAQIKECLDTLDPGSENTGKTIQLIEQLRETLIKVDMRLSDCTSILRGYQTQLFGTPQAEEHGSDTQEFQENLSKLRDALGGTDDESESKGG
tara:strand:+ start:725 stop:1105 length:381 start_codon:yes stop_codon:yes gene_type:complete